MTDNPAAWLVTYLDGTTDATTDADRAEFWRGLPGGVVQEMVLAAAGGCRRLPAADAMPSEEEIAKLISGAPFASARSLSKARAILALFAPVLAEKEAVIRAERFNTENMRKLAAKQKAAGEEYFDRAIAAEAERAAERERAAGILDEWSKPQTMKLHAGEMTAGEVRTTTAILKGAAAAIRAQGE